MSGRVLPLLSLLHRLLTVATSGALDTFLSCFRHFLGAKSDENRKEILSLRSGEELRYDDHILFNPKTSHAVAQLSQKMRSELQQWEDKGYHVYKATIRFIVAWRPKDAPKEEKEHAILLLDLALSKS